MTTGFAASAAMKTPCCAMASLIVPVVIGAPHFFQQSAEGLSIEPQQVQKRTVIVVMVFAPCSAAPFALR